MGAWQPGIPYTDPEPDDITAGVSDDRDEQAADDAARVTGPASSTDDGLVTFDGTAGNLLQNPGVTIAQIRDRTTHTGLRRFSRRATVTQAIPNNTWTNLGWSIRDDSTGGAGALTSASTTITAGSNGAALPQATINVASTADFPTSGFLLINGPPGASTTTLVQYTGKTATTFTGCTLGSGNMATGHVVTHANAEINLPVDGMYNLAAQILWPANSTGRRGVRFMLAGFVPYGDLEVLNTTAAQPMSVFAEIPNTGSTNVYVQVFQTSGGVLNCTADALSHPRVTASWQSALA